MSILVTGGCGFIGSNLVLHLLKTFPDTPVVNLDCMSYNSSAPNVPNGSSHTLVRKNLQDSDVHDILVQHNVRYVYHLAAETNVDASFYNSVKFSSSNVVGTHNLLEAVCKYGKVQRFLFMSTDEVYGQVFGKETESTTMNPTNPYAATKCGAELMVKAYGHSLGLQYVIVRASNVYGPRQYADKLIPRFAMWMLSNEPCQIYGMGKAMRHYVHVSDACDALVLTMKNGEAAQIYNITGDVEFDVNAVYNDLYDIICPTYHRKEGQKYVTDRPFHDLRYNLDGSLLRSLGWTPNIVWSEGIRETVQWYRDHGRDYWSHKKKWIVYGADGWIGKKFVKCLEDRPEIQFVSSTVRANQPELVANELDNVRPANVVCIIGRTQGPGCNSTDWLEHPSRLVDNVRDNLYGPFVIAMECRKRGLHCTYMGSGCIFTYEENRRIFSEADTPNFFGSSYSTVKGFTDEIMKQFDNTVLNCRIRFPIAGEKSPRDFISKLTSFKKICSIPNSMTVLADIIPLIIDLASKEVTGTFNMTNPGVISHNEILEMYREIIDPTFTWENFSYQEMREIIKSDRSNNTLATEKLTALYPGVRPIHEAVKDILQKMKDI